MQGIMMLLFGMYGVVGNFFNPRDSSRESELPLFIFTIVMLVLIFLVGGMQVWFGYSLIRQKQWTTKVIGYICCVPGLLSFPHVISGYTLWVLVQVNTMNARTTQPTIEVEP